jgi:uncharacterized protein (UPF0276 family)
VVAQSCASPIPRSGIGLRAPHYRALLDERPDIGFVEVHSENYFGLGGAPLHYLERARELYPVSLHGVGLSLGSADPLNREHLRKLKALAARIEPALISEHLSWCSVDGRYLNDLLPLPYTEEAVAHVAARIRETQDFLGRQILIENLSSYVTWRHSTLSEWEFVTAVAEAADCLLLFDVNNVYVSACNHDFDPLTCLRAIPPARVKEMHLAGHTVRHYPEGEFRIDTHDAPVCEEVWALYREAAARFASVPALIERDSKLPELGELVAEAHRADDIADSASPSHTASLPRAAGGAS